MRFVALAAVVAAMVVAVLGGQPHRATACSYLPFGPWSFSPWSDRTILDDATVVAAGELVDATERTIVLKVDEYLKGAQPSDELVLNNAGFQVGASCDVVAYPDAPGFVLPEGMNVVAFLQPDHLEGDADWRVAQFGTAIAALEGDLLVLLHPNAARTAPLIEVRAEVERLRDSSFDPAIETTAPCWSHVHGLNAVAGLVELSPLVVIGRFGSPGPERVTLRVEEVLRGTAPAGELEVNNRLLNLDEYTCELTVGPEVWYQPGHRVLAFLTPDDTGLATWRAAAWGRGIYAVVGDQVQVWPGVPSLTMLRELAIERGWQPVRPNAPGAPAAEPPEAGADQGPEPLIQAEPNRDDESRWRWFAAAAALGVLAVAVTLLAARSRRPKP